MPQKEFPFSFKFPFSIIRIFKRTLNTVSDDFMKYNIILHITTACNYNCSYCDVIKDGKSLSRDIYKELISFFKKNKSSIETLKFFGGEPLIAYKDIESICDEIDI